MEVAAIFEKVSLKQFIADCTAHVPDICAIYDAIPLPERSTAGSAGYDFRLPFAITIKPGESLLVPTGIRAKIKAGWVLMLFPRSGLGFKYRLQLDNTVGIIDSDYYNAKNEGHILARITNDSHSEKTLELEAGKGFIQGVFLPFGIVSGDSAANIRTGGFGSTG